VERVAVHVGPAPADLALEWSQNGLRLVTGMRAHRDLVPEDSELALDLCETLLETWVGAASRQAVFDWSYDAPVDVLVMVADVWIRVGALGDEDLARMGVTWAPNHTRPFSDLVTASIGAALTSAGATGLLDRLAEINP